MNHVPALSDAKRQLLEKMMRGEAREQAPPVPPVTPRPTDTVLPLSAGQRQIWLHSTMASGAPLYNEAATIHRFGDFDLAAMRTAINEILCRHEAWRTSFETVDGELVQIVHPHCPIDIPYSDVSELPEAERDAAAVAIATRDARQPIDLTVPPLLRAHIVKLADDNHRIYLALHHMIFDGVALYRVIVPELAAIYDAFAAGRRAELPPPPLQYGDYAVWQRDFVESAQVRKQLDQWRRLLADAPAKLQLPADRAPPPVRTHSGSMEVFSIPRPLADSLKNFSRAEGVTLYMTLLAAFKAMLHRYTGEEDIVIGGVTDLRRRAEIEQLVGYLLNTISLRSKPAGALSFRDYLAQLRETVLTALDASEAPFHLVVRDLKIKAEPGTQPLFNILFSIQPQVEPFPDGWDLTQMDVVTGQAKFDLYLELEERPDGIDGRFLYSTEMFEVATIRRMIGHWLTLLEHVVAHPDALLADLPLLTADESARMLGSWNGTARDLPAASLPQLIASQARDNPDRIALVSGDESLSYADLDREAARIATRLHAAGVKPGSLVGVLMNRSPQTIAGLLAILRLGAAYLPLDPGFPAARLEHIVADAAPDTLLTEPALAKMLSPANCRIVLAEGAADGESPPIAPIDGDDLAYVLYTSGSTGKPKGVEIPHRALLNLLVAMGDEPGFTADDSLLAVTTLSFDIAMLEIFLPLLRGGRLILASRDDALDPGRLADLIATQRPSVMQATPATWRALIENGWTGDRHLKILCGGEALSRDLADQLISRSAELWNMYGPTETTIWSTVQKVERGTGPVAIGRPIANTVTYVLDAGGRQVPVGVIGELYIGGTGVARGYRGRADLTAERFGEKPVAAGVRLYRTGDLARFADDGTLYCLGRTDNDEKIRGFRIAVEEVEGALNSHPAIAAAAVRSWPDGSGHRYLAAYLVGQDGTIPSIAALREHLGGVLPDYMMPSRFEQLAELPMTPNRKVDRKALPEPGEAAARQDFVPPQGAAEERLAAIWRELLGIEAIGRHDNFFDLGGHSLLVARLLARIERDWDRRMGMAEFFQALTLTELAARIECAAPVKIETVVPLQPLGDKPPLLWLDAGPRFRDLALATDPDRPFLGVTLNQIIDAATPGEMRIEGVASEAVKAIREARPTGPYLIGGWCAVGVVAYEVARQMQAAGADVRLLVLGHSMNPVAISRITQAQIRLSKARYHLKIWNGLPLGERWRYAVDRWHGVLEDAGLAEADLGGTVDGRRRVAALLQARDRYVPQPSPVDVALFQPFERLGVFDTEPGWREVVRGGLASYDVPGTHTTITDSPNVEIWARHLRDALDRVAPAPPRAHLRAVG